MYSSDATAIERPLRLLTYLATAIALPLNIAATIVSLDGRQSRVSAFCFIYIPLAVTVTASSMSLKRMAEQGKSPRTAQIKALDLVAIFLYLGALIPCWAIEVRVMRSPGFGLLIGYITAPMILNMFIHGYFTTSHVQWKKLFSKIGFGGQSACQQCPNCQMKFVSGEAQTSTKKGYSLLRGEDYLDIEADPVQYRDSEDFLGEGADRAEQVEPAEQARAAEDGGKVQDMAKI